MPHNGAQIVLSLIILFSSSCVEEYQPDLSRYEEILVVDGTLSNEEGPYSVTLSKSASVYNPVNTAYTGANVAIMDGNGHTEILAEQKPGIYSTFNSAFRGEIGEKYKLIIQLPDGNTYESDYETLMAAPPIDSVYSEIRMEPTENEYYTREGVQFFVDTKNQLNTSLSLIWRMEETYKYHSDFTIDYIFNGFIEKNPNPYMFYWCYRTNSIPETKAYLTKQANSPEVSRYPLTYVDTESNKLSVRYSLLVKQYSVSENAANFWYQINKQNEEQGTFYSRQPYQIAGNIHNTENPKEIVLGYFLVGGVSTKRIFVNRPTDLNFYYSNCMLDPDGMAFLGATPQRNWPVYINYSNLGQMAIAGRSCFDCRLWGGEFQKPDFWE